MENVKPTQELITTKLWKYLNTINPIYANKTLVFLENISPILDSIEEYFPFYTRHDAHHGFEVIKRIEQIVDKQCFIKASEKAFSAEESYLLICSAYAHDLGMALLPNEEETISNQLNFELNGNWKSNSKLQSHLRKHHSERGGVFIDKNSNQLQVPKSLVFCLDKLMRAHNYSTHQLDSEFHGRVAAGQIEIDLKQLACILCIADSLEFSESRVIDGVLKKLNDKLEESEDESLLISFRENMKHFCIGDSVAIGEDGRIIFSGTFNDPDVLSLAHQTIDYIKEWVTSYLDIEFNSKPKRLIVKGDSISCSLNIIGSDFERIGIRIKKENIIDLISSNSVWENDPCTVLRELLQNSIEACRFRLHHSSKHHGYSPEIKVISDKKLRLIQIIDNGCGMSRNIILNNFLTIGNSRSFDPTYSNDNYSSLARFGIGFWSVFTIAKKATITTAPFENINQYGLANDEINGLQFDVSIEKIKDYTVFLKVNTSAGTKITLYLKETISIDDILSRLSYHLACSEIPIKIIHTGQETIIPLNVSLPSFASIFGPKIQFVQQYKIEQFSLEKEIDNISFRIMIFYRNENNRITFLLPNQQNIKFLAHDFTLMNRFISVCGFLSNFGRFNKLINIDACSIIVVNAKDPKGYSFTLNRMGLIPTAQSKMLDELISEQSIHAYRLFLIKNNNYSPESIYRLNSELSRSNQLDSNYDRTNKILYFFEKAPDLLAFKLIKLRKGDSYHHADVLYLDLKQLLEADFEIWNYNQHYSINGFIDFKGKQDEIYGMISQLEYNENTYFMENDIGVSHLTDNDANYTLVIKNLITPSNVYKMVFGNFKTKSIIPSNDHSWFIGSVRGIWTGSILKREMIGGQFCFYGQHTLVINRKSRLVKVITELFRDEQNQKICVLIKLLENAYCGIINPEVAEFMH